VNRLVVSILLVCTLALAACGTGSSNQTASNTTTTTRPTEPTTDITLQDDSLSVAVAAKGLTMPTSLVFAAGRMFVTEKTTGKVRVVENPGTATDVLDLAVNSFDERGLLGIAVHPDFEIKPFVYLQWTWRGDGDGPQHILGTDSDKSPEVPELGNRVDRFRWNGERLVFDRNIIRMRSNTLVTDTTGRIRGNHDAGPLAFGPDGKLYFMLGDQNLRGRLQNIADGPAPDDPNFTGVMLRLNDDGSTPGDNPFFAAGKAMGGQAGANVEKVWVYGIRNSFGLAFEPTSGALWQTENGDDASDEINVFTRGSNSGWIQLMGTPQRFDEWKGIEVGTKDGFDNPTWPPTKLQADAAAAQKAMVALPGSHYTAPVLTYVRPPALTSIGFVRTDALGARSRDTAWVGTVLTNSLLRYPLAKNGRGLALTGGLADGVDDNKAKGDLGESAGSVVGKGFGIITSIQVGPDGALYVMSLDKGSVYRLSAAATSGTSATTAPPTTGGAAAAAATVHIKDDLFDPAEVQVAKGDTVAWVWDGKNPHNVDGPGFKSDIQTSGRFTHTFDQPGRFDYRCDVHPNMLAAVVVKG
jgi:glucose/arabinose dehydrogenase